MADTFSLVDPLDVSTVRLALNDGGGGTGITLLEGVDTGTIPADNDLLISPGTYGATVASTGFPPMETTLRLKVKQTTFADLLSKLRTLARELQRGGTIKLQFDGEAAARYCNFHPSPQPTLLTSMWPATKSLDDFTWQGVVSILREPVWYSASETLVNATALTNTVAGAEVKATTTGTLPSPARIEIQVDDAAADVVQARFGIKSGDDTDLTDFAAVYSHELEDAALTGNTASAVDADASGGDVALTTYAASGYFLKRWRVEIDPANKDALAGKYRVYAVVKMTAASKQTLQLKWGTRDVDPVDRANDEVVLDAQEATGAQFVPVYLGRIKFENDSDVLVLEGWSRLDVAAGSDTLAWDCVHLMPADGKITTVSVLGFRSGQPAKESWLGSDLVTPSSPAGLTAGSDDETQRRLVTTSDAAGTPPNAGTVYPAGKVVAKVFCTLKQSPGSARQKLGELRIRNVTGATNTATRDLYTKKNRAETDLEKEVVFTADGSSNYQIQVVYTKSSPAASEKIVIGELKSKFIRTVNNGDTIVIDPLDPEQTGIWSSGVKVQDVILSGAIPTLEPGANTFVFQVGDWSGAAYQQDVDDREPLAKIVAGRTYDVTVKATPYHSV